ncbi:transcription initiation factor TFIID subunit 8-like [Rhopalosiphum maidis]|uniref:transcription initiation factor TFIID subunit 8-like n=1 Tax=Rhopalosiphum maidis TaxID=43146 RepID=UPI000EFDF273|nr:transcription initiation factor TFIID subunit 8-like [Rhopalosiphum maidis]XP_060844986.1 transcription initiation factor TFIID subunit 8-like [Rhopalosiphum padi]
MDKTMERKFLKTTVAGILMEIGFQAAEPGALETLVEMLYSILSQMGNSSRRYAEIAGRLEPLGADVMMGLIDMGMFKNASSLLAYAKRSNRAVLPSPIPSVQPRQTSNLQAGTRLPHPSYMPSYMPAFPDPHAYIRTPTHKQPVTEYEAIREKSAIQKHELEKSLIKFLIKTGPTESLFLNQENDCFALIANKPQQPAYFSALLPQDQVFDEDPDETEIPAPSKKIKFKKEIQIKEDFDENEEQENENEEEEEVNNGDETESKPEEPIDNPFLRPVKYPAAP